MSVRRPDESLSSAQRRSADRVARREERLVELTREIAWMAGKDLDDNDVRAILSAIVRRWSTTVPVKFTSEAARSGGPTHLEHVVPVRVIVDRMIRKPRGVERILRTAVVLARVTPEEHAALGSLKVTHAELYAQMTACRGDELVALGWKRYRRRGVSVSDATGRTPWRQ